MTLMSWLREHLRCGRTVERADAAINLATDVATSARSLQQQLAPFSRADDPFHAVFTRQALAAEHEKKVEFDETPRAH